MKPSTQLLAFVEEKKLPWIYYSPERGRMVIVIDNHLLSIYRACPQYFMHYAVEGWRKRGVNGQGRERIWFFDFGILFHKMMEEYYRIFKEPSFDLQSFAIDSAFKNWTEMEMDYHLSHKECQAMGGYPGFAGMLIQYALQFKAENERMTVLATEVSFGKGLEVPVYVWGSDADSDTGIFSYADIFLSGRLDILADDGAFILPLDHKTCSFRTGRDPMRRYVNDDGPTGYVYSLSKILPSIVPEDMILKRQCNRISMNLISKSIPKEGPRFKRLALYKSEEVLRAYRYRQIATCNNLLSDLDAYVRGLGTPRNTRLCTDWYYQECTYIDVCRQQDRAGEQATLENSFRILPVWDTEAMQGVVEPED